MDETIPTEQHEVEGVEEVLYCSLHPGVQTNLRCNRCGRPMCTRCAVRTPVGYRCRECVRGQQAKFYNAHALDPLIAGAISVVLSAIGAGIVGTIGFFYLSFILSPAVGALIADVVHRAVGRRRGQYSWLVVAGGVVVGGLIPALSLSLFFNIGWWIYLVMATGAAIGRLRLGR
jgi:hypothetical protein